ncbi:MAG: hypothetical protein HY216_06375 [Candidatus Rokubacteria bacterium]|nr:hypothetical protein [Candidatus Rokubacteria bacterium]
MCRNRALALVALALALAGAGCARKAWIYEKPNVTPVRLDADIAECRKVATVHGQFVMIGADRVDLKLFQSCMAKKGYTARQEEEP